MGKYKLNGTAFNTDAVLAYKSKSEWIEKNIDSHFLNCNKAAREKYLGQVYDDIVPKKEEPKVEVKQTKKGK